MNESSKGIIEEGDDELELDDEYEDDSSASKFSPGAIIEQLKEMASDSAGKKKLIVIGIMVFALIFLIKSMFFGGIKKVRTTTAGTSSSNVDDDTVSGILGDIVAGDPSGNAGNTNILPDIPDTPPPLVMPDVPELPDDNNSEGSGDVPEIDIPVSFNQANSSIDTDPIIRPPADIFDFNAGRSNSGPVDPGPQENWAAPMVAIGGGEVESDDQGSSDPINLNLPPQHTSATQIAVTSYGNRSLMIAQGKTIDIIIETAINTGLPGYVRGIVSRDVPSESGKNILIAKGSRVVGSYVNTSGNTVDIIWHRIMRSDGIDIVVDNKAVDNLGRMGVQGTLDVKLLEILKNALLVSTITVGSTGLAFKIAGDDGQAVSVRNNSDGTNTVNASPADMAIKDTINKINDRMTSAVDSMTDTRKVVKVDQGTKTQLFVNQDILFSKSVANLHDGDR